MTDEVLGYLDHAHQELSAGQILKRLRRDQVKRQSRGTSSIITISTEAHRISSPENSSGVQHYQCRNGDRRSIGYRKEIVWRPTEVKHVTRRGLGERLKIHKSQQREYYLYAHRKLHLRRGQR